MSDVVVRLDREEIEGVVAVGSRVRDVLKRFGVRGFDDCKPGSAIHVCAVVIEADDAQLSPLSDVETEHFALAGRKQGERLACETTIAQPGEVIIMTEEKKKPDTEKQKKDKFVEEFEALPLGDKLSSLFKMEAVAFSEAIDYMIKSPMEVLSKVGDAVSEFGVKIETEVKKAAGAAKAKAEDDEQAEKKSAPPKARKTAARPKKNVG